MTTFAYKAFVDWDFNGVFTEETSYLVRAAGTWQFNPPEAVATSSSGIVPGGTVVFSNKTGRFSPLNTSSAIYSAISGGGSYLAPIYLEVSINGGAYEKIFTGVIKLPSIEGASASQYPVVSFDIRGVEEKFLNVKQTTTSADFADWYDAGNTESELIEEWLTDLGLTSSDWSLDTGLFNIPFSKLADTSLIEAAWLLSSSCGGRFYSTPDGKFRYENMWHWLTSPHTTSQETFTTANWVTHNLAFDDKDLYNKIIVKLARGTLGPVEDIYEQSGIFEVEPGITKTFKANITSSIYSVSAVTYDVQSSGGTDMTADVTVTPTYLASSIEFEIENSHATKTAEFSNLVVSGRVVSYASDEQVEKSSVNAFWTSRPTRTRTVTDSTYIQTQAQAETLAEFLKDRHELPRFLYTIQGAVGKTSRLLGDRITINDASIMSASRDAFIISIGWSIDHNGFTQDITALDATSLFPYMDTSPGYFIINVNDLGTSDPQRGRLFY